MTRIATNGIELEYLWHGDTTNPVVVGVVGLSDQLIRWPVPLIDAVVQAGFSFLVFDARDMGLSTHFDDAPTPDMRQALSGEVSFDLPFSLRDMAQDTLGLMGSAEHHAGSLNGLFDGWCGFATCDCGPPRVIRELHLDILDELRARSTRARCRSERAYARLCRDRLVKSRMG